MYYIAIDIGSSYIKSVLFHMDEQRIVEKSKYATPTPIPCENKRVFEVDAQQMLALAQKLIEGYCDRYDSIEGVLFSTQMHGCVYSDPSMGRDTYISWQDSRCLCLIPGADESYLQRLEQLFTQREMQNTGVAIKPSLALCNLYSLLHERNFQIGPQAGVYTLGSYFIAKLTGHNTCHITNAAPMGLVDLTTGLWRTDMIQKAGMGSIAFPKIVQNLDACGVFRYKGAEIPVYPDLGDMQTAVLGCMADAGDMVVNIATAGQVILLQERFTPGDYEVRPFFDGLYCNVVSRMPAGRNLDVQVDYLREAGEKVFGVNISREEVWQRILQDLELHDPQGLRVDSSFYEMPHKLADGSITHINHFNMTISNVFAAMLQDIGRVYKRYIRLLCGSGELQGRLVFSGGAAWNNPLLVAAIEKEAGLPASLSPMRDEVYAGMFRVALVTTGRCPTLHHTKERMLKP